MQSVFMRNMHTGLSFKKEMNFVTEKTFTNIKCENLAWKEVKTQNALHTAIFDIDVSNRTASDGRSADFVIMNNSDWVSVVPFFKGTDGQNYFVMEKQFRHGTCSETLEFPGGIIEKGENPEDAALRELKEETGIIAHEIEKIGAICPNSAFMHNTQHVFLAQCLEYTGIVDFDENEYVVPLTVPVKDVITSMGEGMYSNGAMLPVVYFFIREKNLICTEKL